MSKQSKTLGFLAAAIIISGMAIIDYYKDQNQETQETIEKMELPTIQYNLYKMRENRI